MVGILACNPPILSRKPGYWGCINDSEGTPHVVAGLYWDRSNINTFSMRDLCLCGNGEGSRFGGPCSGGDLHDLWYMEGRSYTDLNQILMGFLQDTWSLVYAIGRSSGFPFHCLPFLFNTGFIIGVEALQIHFLIPSCSSHKTVEKKERR